MNVEERRYAICCSVQELRTAHHVHESTVTDLERYDVMQNQRHLARNAQPAAAQVKCATSVERRKREDQAKGM